MRMRKIKYISCAVVAALLAPLLRPAYSQSAAPPIAEVRTTTFEEHGGTRADEYYWLRERDNPAVISYLEEENAYLEQVMGHTNDLQETLFGEIRGRIKQDDSTVPYRQGDYFYYTRFEDGKEYPIYCRKRGSLEADEQIILDVNELAEGKGFFQVATTTTTEDERFFAFAVDSVGRRFYTIRFKDLTTGEYLEDEIPSVTPNITWATDNQTLFYTKQHPETLRWHRIYRHKLGTDTTEDVLVYEELDETFDSFVTKTRSKKYILIGSSQTLSDEYRFVDAATPAAEFTVIQPRERDLEYRVSHLGGHFYIRTNLDAENFRLMRAPVSNPSKDHWEEVIAHRPSIYLADFDLFKDFLVLTERKDGLTTCP
jgi:oligopeptidase B